MGSKYFGEQNMGNERGSPSARKGKKSNSSDKPKQPQRGLGVAQLEKIRLHSQMASSYHPNLHLSYPTSPTDLINQEDMRVQASFSSMPSPSYSSSNSPASPYGFHHGVMPGLSHNHYERTNMIRYSDSPPVTSWIPNTGVIEAPHFVHPSMNRHNRNNECSSQKRIETPWSDSSETQEVDLELRL